MISNMLEAGKKFDVPLRNFHQHIGKELRTELFKGIVDGYKRNYTSCKVLMAYHNIYDSWAWTGGHVDGEEDLYEVALREVKEETSVNNLNPISEDIISLEVLSVNGHFKNNQYVSSHLHLNVTYVFVCDEKEKTKIKEDENSGIMWIDVKDLEKYCTEPQMIVIYRKIISSAKRLLEKE